MSDVADSEPSASAPAEPAPPEEPEETAASAEADAAARYRAAQKAFLEDMLRKFDMVVWGHFSYLYLLDCSFWRLLLRSTVQLQFLTPKPPGIPAVPLRRPVLYAIIGSSALCALIHLFSAAPSASELEYGYLHGGLIIDFIGQKGPISKLRLVLVDVLIVLLQLAMLAVVVHKQDLRLDRSSAMQREPGAVFSPTLSQDLESEERGERRRRSSISSILSSTDSGDAVSRERTADGVNPVSERRQAELERKRFEISSGEFQVAKVNVVNVVKRQWEEGREVAVATTAGSGARGTMAGTGSHVVTASPMEVLLRGRTGVT